MKVGCSDVSQQATCLESTNLEGLSGISCVTYKTPLLFAPGDPGHNTEYSTGLFNNLVYCTLILLWLNKSSFQCSGKPRGNGHYIDVNLEQI